MTTDSTDESANYEAFQSYATGAHLSGLPWLIMILVCEVFNLP